MTTELHARLHEFPGHAWRLRWGGDFAGWGVARWNQQVLAAIDGARVVLEPLAIELALGLEDHIGDDGSWTHDLLIAPGLPTDMALTPTYERSATHELPDLGPTLRAQIASLTGDGRWIMRVEIRGGRAFLASDAEAMVLEVGRGDRRRIAVDHSDDRPAVVGPIAGHRTEPPLSLTVNDSMGVEIAAHWSYWTGGDGRALVDQAIAALEGLGWARESAPERAS